MKKFCALVLSILLLMALISRGPRELSPEKAVAKLEKAMVYTEEVEEGLRTEDGLQLVWDQESLHEGDVYGEEAYVISLYYANDLKTELAGQHYTDYAITLDGHLCYRYDGNAENPDWPWIEL